MYWHTWILQLYMQCRIWRRRTKLCKWGNWRWLDVLTLSSLPAGSLLRDTSEGMFVLAITISVAQWLFVCSCLLKLIFCALNLKILTKKITPKMSNISVVPFSAISAIINKNRAFFFQNFKYEFCKSAKYGWKYCTAQEKCPLSTLNLTPNLSSKPPNLNPNLP